MQKNYETLLDSLQIAAIYVIREDNHQIMYFNRRVRDILPNVEIGMVCHELLAGFCSNCPLLTIGDKKESRSIDYDNPFGRAVDIVASRILWEGIPAFSIAITSHVDAVSFTYGWIFRVNLQTGLLDVIQGEIGGHESSLARTRNLQEWIEDLAGEGSIYGGDIDRVRRFARLSYLRRKLGEGDQALTCTYRRRQGKEYRWYMMEVVPSFDNGDSGQFAMLYIKDVHDVYRKGLELEEINIQHREIIKSLGEMNFGVYLVNLSTGISHPVRTADFMGEVMCPKMMAWDDTLNCLLEVFFHPDSRKEILASFSLSALNGIWEKGGKKEALCRYLREGEYRYVSVTAHFFEGGDRERNVVLALLDVDERIRKEIKHNQDDRRMAAIIKHGYDVMNSVNLATGVCERIYLNGKGDLGKVYTQDYEYYVQKAANEWIHEDDRERFRIVMSLKNLRHMASSMEDSAQFSSQFRTKDPKMEWVEEELFLIRQDGGVTANILSRDVTREKKREAEYSREKRERNHIINSMGSLFLAAYYLDLEADTYKMVAHKGMVGKLLGEERSCTEAFRKHAMGYVHPDDRKEFLEKMNCGNFRRRLSQEQRQFALEYRRSAREEGMGKNDGWMRATVVLSEAQDGMPKKALYVVQDVTESKEKEEREHRLLKDAYEVALNASASKSDFLSRMSHDIRTPMNAIIGMTAIAGAHLQEPERVEDCLNKINAASRHLLSLVNEILDMSKIETGKIDLAEEEFNLSDLLQDVLATVRPALQAKCHELKFHVELAHEDVIGDVMRLQQVFINILENAVKYTMPEGKLELEIREKDCRDFGYGCYEFVFKDNGVGMTPEFVERIFEPFSRAEDSRISKVEGAGLGMTIAQNIIKMMNGDICIDSQVGSGTQISVTVFLKQQSTKVADLERYAGLRVLVVDDDRYICEVVCGVLEEMKIVGKWTQRGRDAVRLVREAEDAGEGYFAVILDWQMPDMDGVETAKAIRREAGERIKVIMLSGYDWSEVESEVRDAGVDGFLSKPLLKSRLVYLLKKIAIEDKMEEKAEGPGEGEDAMPSFHGKRILLTEDNELNREIAMEIIGSTGAIVECAEDGKQGVEKFLEKEEGYYDLIFMDIQMPVMNGHEATEAIRKLDRKDAARIPIIALTANAYTEDVIASRKAGMNEHMTKPLMIEKLMECMKRWLK